MTKEDDQKEMVRLREESLSADRTSMFRTVLNNQAEKHYQLKTKTKIKRYWLFVYDTHYPNGGLHDLYDTFDTLVEAKEYFDNEHSEHICHIFDSQKHCMIDIGRDWEWLKRQNRRRAEREIVRSAMNWMTSKGGDINDLVDEYCRSHLGF